MIKIYKLTGNFNNPYFEQVAVWKDGEFIEGFEDKMDRDDVLRQFNSGYYRTNEKVESKE